jgi:hypothetical protein
LGWDEEEAMAFEYGNNQPGMIDRKSRVKRSMMGQYGLVCFALVWFGGHDMRQ